MPYRAQQAIDAVTEHGGVALVKFLARNDTDATTSHQGGILLPKAVAGVLTTIERVKNERAARDPDVTWHDDRTLKMRITWYGQKNKAEFRLTRFGRDCPYRTADAVGDLFVLVPVEVDCRYLAFMLDTGEDIEEFLDWFGIGMMRANHLVLTGRQSAAADPDDFRRRVTAGSEALAEGVDEFPTTAWMSQSARDLVNRCHGGATDDHSPDALIVDLMDAEYSLFSTIEQRICHPRIQRAAQGALNGTIAEAMSIINRRKNRAGRSFENHFGYLLERARIPYEPRSRRAGGIDVIIPGADEYEAGASGVLRLP